MIQQPNKELQTNQTAKVITHKTESIDIETDLEDTPDIMDMGLNDLSTEAE